MVYSVSLSLSEAFKRLNKRNTSYTGFSATAYFRSFK